MLFSIFAFDKDNSLAARKENRAAHLARLEELDSQGRLKIAGPNPLTQGEGFSGSLIVAEFASLAEANNWAGSDPYILGGVYEKVEVKPFTQVFPKEAE